MGSGRQNVDWYLLSIFLMCFNKLRRSFLDNLFSLFVVTGLCAMLTLRMNVSYCNMISVNYNTRLTTIKIPEI
jgi:hypothetical protein